MEVNLSVKLDSKFFSRLLIAASFNELGEGWIEIATKYILEEDKHYNIPSVYLPMIVNLLSCIPLETIKEFFLHKSNELNNRQENNYGYQILNVKRLKIGYNLSFSHVLHST